MTDNIPVGRYINTSNVKNQAQGALTKTELEYKYDPAQHDYYSKQEIAEIMHSKKTAEENGYGEALDQFVASTATKILEEVHMEHVSAEDNTTVEVFITKKV